MSSSSRAELGSTRPPEAEALGGGGRSARFTWTAFWCLVVLLAAYVLAFQDDVPYYDDWSVALVVVQDHEITLDWLWAQHNEHRIPLGRLILYGSFRYLGLDPRPPMMLNLIFLAGAAALLLGACRDLRGRLAPQDLAIPLLLVGLGQYFNALWAFQVALTAAVFLFALALLCMVRASLADRPGASLLAALATVLLPPTGAFGLVLGMVLAAWCLWHATRLLTRGRARSRLAGLVLLAVPLVVGSYAWLYLHGLRSLMPSAGSVERLVQGSAGTATVGLGPATAADLPWGWALVGLAALGGLALVWRILRSPDDREPAMALLAGLAAGWGLIAAISYGRSSGGIGATLVPRYVGLGSIGIVALYLVGVRLEVRRLGYLLTLPILVAVLWRQPQSLATALEHGVERYERGQAFAADVAAGVPLEDLVRHHLGYFTEDVTNSGQVVAWICALDHEGAGPFASPSPRLSVRKEPFREIEVRLTPLRFGGTLFEAGRGKTLESDAQLWFALDAPVQMIGIRVAMKVELPEGGTAWSQLYWGLSETDDPVFSQERSMGFHAWAHQTSFILWCEGTLDRLRFDPDTKIGTRFAIERIAVLALPE